MLHRNSIHNYSSKILSNPNTSALMRALTKGKQICLKTANHGVVFPSRVVFILALLVIHFPISAATTNQAAPDWVNNLTPGTWSEISFNTISDVDPEKDPAANPNYPNTAPWAGGTGHRAVIDAWNGGAFASGFGQFGSLMVFGGGHGDYYGSEVYSFDMGTRRWSRITNPYAGPYSWPNSNGEYPDGSPLPPHTYDFLEYYPPTNSLVLLYGVQQLGQLLEYSFYLPIAHILDLDTLTWHRSPLNEGIRIHEGGYSTFDSRRNVLWVEGSSGSTAFCKFEPNIDNGDGTLGRWTNYSIKVDQLDSVAAYDPINDLFVMQAYRNLKNIYAFDLKQPDNQEVKLNEDPNSDFPIKSSQAGWEWSDARNAFIYWTKSDPENVFEFRLTSGDWKTGLWTWRKITDASSNTVVPQPNRENGTYGRFRVAHYTDAEVALIITRVDGPVYAFRVPPSDLPPPPSTVVEPSPPNNLIAE